MVQLVSKLELAISANGIAAASAVGSARTSALITLFGRSDSSDAAAAPTAAGGRGASSDDRSSSRDGLRAALAVGPVPQMEQNGCVYVDGANDPFRDSAPLLEFCRTIPPAPPGETASDAPIPPVPVPALDGRR